MGSTSSADTLIGEGLVARLCSFHRGEGRKGGLSALDISISMLGMNGNMSLMPKTVEEVFDNFTTSLSKSEEGKSRFHQCVENAVLQVSEGKDGNKPTPYFSVFS